MAMRLRSRTHPACLMVLVCLALSALMLSCGGDTPWSSWQRASEVNEDGWALYAEGDYAGAAIEFEAALEIEPAFTEALLGLAWCKSHDGEFEAALDDYDTVLASGEFETDAYAGRAAAALAATEASLAVASADSALSRSPSYEFGRHEEYNWRDLRLILAQAHFALGQYAYAQAEVDLLDPDNGLDPGDSETWVVDGLVHPTYEAALAMEIELLCSIEDIGILQHLSQVFE